MRSRITILFNAPGVLGAFLFSICLLLTSGCDRKTRTPEWQADSRVLVPSGTRGSGSRSGPSANAEAPVLPLRFVSYNVRNWITPADAEPASKSENEKQAVIDMISMARPDVLGISEIGDAEDLASLKKRLLGADIHLPYTQHIRGTDPERHLALLSRFPIVATGEASHTDYRLNGITHGILRGILDATIQAGDRKYRFIGVHLKSKRDAAEADQEEMRYHEANLVRRHIDEILSADPDTRLIVYGDFNDTRASATLKTVQGPFNGPHGLRPSPLQDRNGETWTQHWAAQDIYSRFDWVLLSRNLEDSFNRTESRILDNPRWKDASDHRPLLVVLE